MFDFGQQLKALRTEKGLTQEQAAELLNVSKQSISRWENNMTYPDVTFLPTLAAFYGISVDTLLGADYDRNKQIQDQYFESRHKAYQHGDNQAAFELSQELYARFPNNTTIINAFMTDACLMGRRDEIEDKTHYLGMAIEAGQRLIKLTDDIEEQCRAIKAIALSYRALGDQANAEVWNAKLPSIWNSIDVTCLNIFQGQKRLESAWCSLEAAIQVMNIIIMAICEGATSASEKQAIISKVPALLKVLFEDKDYGFYHVLFSRAYMKLAGLTVEDADVAFDYIQKAFEHAAHADSEPSSPRSSALFRGQTVSRWCWTGFAENYTEEMKQILRGAEYEVLRTDSRYQKYVE